MEHERFCYGYLIEKEGLESWIVDSKRISKESEEAERHLQTCL